ncbi:hypothetical protein [Sporosarcina sp. Te-1]|uniref:hypothetical protein n=1 Tax=Sporosarcina sp. Te-1 TaxID=2818390 RepID=UPI001A9F56F8|nr:hypothetical protein [Sporosarcina sp. Te-1]QTD42494.1 hypothetical protein J3U78_06705 [Sporosarcina sp. Te-1]
MKLNWKLVSTGIAAALFLAACGTDKDSSKPDEGASAPDQVVTDAGSEENGSSASEDDQKDNALDNAESVTSEEQNYTIQVLPGFTWTAEEPGRDVLYSDNNSEAFMRIETKENDGDSYDDWVANVQELVKASTDQDAQKVTDVNLLPSGQGIENAVAFNSKSDDVSTTGVVFVKGDLLVRLTIFDTPEEELGADFIKMAETIQAK